jgi:hypothetical protein
VNEYTTTTEVDRGRSEQVHEAAEAIVNEAAEKLMGIWSSWRWTSGNDAFDTIRNWSEQWRSIGKSATMACEPLQTSNCWWCLIG